MLFVFLSCWLGGGGGGGGGDFGSRGDLVVDGRVAARLSRRFLDRF